MSTSNSDNNTIPGVGIEDQEIIGILERIVSLSQNLLEKNQHVLVFNIFLHLVRNDLHLRKKIAYELFPGAVDDFQPQYTQEELNSIIQLQTFANNYRIQFLVRITDYIVGKYKKATEMVKKDFNEGTRLFKNAQDLDFWYIKQIKSSFKDSLNLDKSISEFENQMYDEMVQVLTEVSETGLNSMQKILKEALQKFRFDPFK
ncbi:MAG: hypothetical protein HeimC3_08230 [Candidatus Heimdallarchaeota archaeon LC_3]|nr:MAG: hypothetical protein HeimC3_08230 [Candidatus Heimdallarchaeota archaeon LC_3]